MPRISIDGAESGRILRKRFESYGLNIEDAAEEILFREAKKIEADAALLAPVDTGELRNSIGTRKVGPLDFEIGSSAKHAPFVEFGTKNQRAQPFLTEALRKNESSIRKAMRDAIKAGMR